MATATKEEKITNPLCFRNQLTTTLTYNRKYRLLFRTYNKVTMLLLLLQLHPLLHRLEDTHHQHQMLDNKFLLHQQDTNHL